MKASMDQIKPYRSQRKPGTETDGDGTDGDGTGGEPDYDKIYGIHADNPYWIGIITPNNPPRVINAGEKMVII